MATSYPGGLDNFPNPGANDQQNSPGALNHATQHDNINDAVEALETKVGVNGSGDTSSVDNKLTAVIAQSASTTSTVTTLSGTVSGFSSSITNLQSANVNGPASQGQIFVPASATSGSAINAAIAALPAGGGTVLLGAGTHTLDVAISLNKSSVAIVGVSNAATAMVWDASAIPVAIKMADTTQRRFFLRDFAMFTTAGSAGLGKAIYAAYFVDSVIERLIIGTNATSSPNVGIDFNAGVAGTYYNEVRNCRIFTSGTTPFCIYFNNNSNSNAVSNTRLGCVSNTGTGTGVFIDRCYSILMTHIDMEACDAIGVDVGGNTGASSATTRDITIINGYFEALTIGVRLASGSIAVNLFGSQFNNCTTADFQDNGCQAARLIGVTLEGHAYGYSSHPASRVIRTAGTYSLTHAEVYGASALRIRLVGGGGAGGGAATTGAGQAAVGGGGQAGAYTEATVGTEVLTYPVSIVIGSGGSAVSGGAGNSGANSTFGGTLMVAPGGNGGTTMAAGATVAIAVGGQGSNAGSVAAPVSGVTAIILAGGEGSSGYRVAGATIGQWAGNGGANPLGAAIAAPGTNVSSSGRTGFQYGSGGAGGINGASQGSAVSGGAGADGVCIIELIY
jgi:hypothetical protein